MRTVLITITKVSLLLGLAGYFTGCASMSGLQTARTLKKGEAQSTFGGGQYSSGDIASSVDDSLNGDDISAPFLEYSYRQGFGENWDAGIKLTLIGTAVIDAKYNLYSDENFAFSVGGGLGYLSITSESGDEETETTILDLMLPVYVSYDFSDSFSIYAVPKYISRSISGGASGSASLLGASAGVKIGKEWGTFLEVGQFRDSKNDLDVSQANVAIFWHPSKSWF